MADADDASPLPVAWPLLNDTSLILLLLTVLLGVYATYLVRPRPLVHPLLLGRQSELSPTREKGRSGVYRSFAAGHGPPVRRSRKRSWTRAEGPGGRGATH
jgi:hypothetical protein